MPIPCLGSFDHINQYKHECEYVGFTQKQICMSCNENEVYAINVDDILTTFGHFHLIDNGKKVASIIWHLDKLSIMAQENILLKGFSQVGSVEIHAMKDVMLKGVFKIRGSFHLQTNNLVNDGQLNASVMNIKIHQTIVNKENLSGDSAIVKGYDKLDNCGKLFFDQSITLNGKNYVNDGSLQTETLTSTHETMEDFGLLKSKQALIYLDHGEFRGEFTCGFGYIKAEEDLTVCDEAKFYASHSLVLEAGNQLKFNGEYESYLDNKISKSCDMPEGMILMAKTLLTQAGRIISVNGPVKYETQGQFQHLGDTYAKHQNIDIQAFELTLITH